MYVVVSYHLTSHRTYSIRELYVPRPVFGCGIVFVCTNTTTHIVIACQFIHGVLVFLCRLLGEIII